MEIIQSYSVHKNNKLYLYDHYTSSHTTFFHSLKGRFFKHKKYWVFPSSVLEPQPVVVEQEQPVIVVKEQPVVVQQEQPVVVQQEQPVVVQQEQSVVVVQQEQPVVVQQEPVVVQEQEPVVVQEQEPVVVEQEPVVVVKEQQTKPFITFSPQVRESYIYSPPPFYFDFVQPYTTLLQKIDLKT